MSPQATLSGFDPARIGTGDGPPRDPRDVLTAIGIAIYDWDMATDRITWAANAADVLGVPNLASCGLGRDFAQIVEPGSGRTRLEAIGAATETDAGSGVPYATRYGLRLDPARVIAVEDTGRWYADAEGKPVRAHGMVRVSGRDTDTELAPGQRERSAFLRDIAGEVAEAGRTKRALTLFVLSIENLATLNDELGFDGGDDVIREVLARMRSVMRRRDRFARYGGNRFALALRSCPPDQARIAAERIEKVISAEPIQTLKGPMTAQVLIGAASAPDHALEPPVLLRRAEQSLAIAKRRVGQGFVLYDQKVFRGADRPAGRNGATDVIGLLNSRDIVLALQPVVEAGSRRVAFSEALLRVRDQGRIISAGDVVPGMERSGLVPLVDMRILELAADRLAAYPDERLSINVSPLTLDSPDWLATLAAHLGSRPGIAPRLIVEVTETVAIREPDAVRRKLDLMKALGVSIAIDDFGAGHTSFKHLRNFAVDIVKIDGAFVQNLSRTPSDVFFVRTLVDLAHNLGVSTVAEWVEDEATASLLAGMGVDYLQGDHCGRPAVDEPGLAPTRAVAG